MTIHRDPDRIDSLVRERDRLSGSLQDLREEYLRARKESRVAQAALDRYLSLGDEEPLFAGLTPSPAIPTTNGATHAWSTQTDSLDGARETTADAPVSDGATPRDEDSRTPRQGTEGGVGTDRSPGTEADTGAGCAAVAAGDGEPGTGLRPVAQARAAVACPVTRDTLLLALPGLRPLDEHGMALMDAGLKTVGDVLDRAATERYAHHASPLRVYAVLRGARLPSSVAQDLDTAIGAFRGELYAPAPGNDAAPPDCGSEGPGGMRCTHIVGHTGGHRWELPKPTPAPVKKTKRRKRQASSVSFAQAAAIAAQRVTDAPEPASQTVTSEAPPASPPRLRIGDRVRLLTDPAGRGLLTSISDRAGDVATHCVCWDRKPGVIRFPTTWHEPDGLELIPESSDPEGTPLKPGHTLSVTLLSSDTTVCSVEDCGNRATLTVRYAPVDGGPALQAWFCAAHTKRERKRWEAEQSRPAPGTGKLTRAQPQTVDPTDAFFASAQTLPPLHVAADQVGKFGDAVSRCSRCGQESSDDPCCACLPQNAPPDEGFAPSTCATGRRQVATPPPTDLPRRISPGLATHPLSLLHGIPTAMAKRLAKAGFHTAGDVAGKAPETLAGVKAADAMQVTTEVEIWLRKSLAEQEVTT